MRLMGACAGAAQILAAAHPKASALAEYQGMMRGTECDVYCVSGKAGLDHARLYWCQRLPRMSHRHWHGLQPKSLVLRGALQGQYRQELSGYVLPGRSHSDFNSKEQLSCSYEVLCARNCGSTSCQVTLREAATEKF